MLQRDVVGWSMHETRQLNDERSVARRSVVF